MSSPPWMPLNVGDYLRDTVHLSVFEHGAYLLLIMRYWLDGSLPADERLVSRYAHLTAEQWAESRDVLAALFDEGWKHKRIDAELAKAADIISKRKASAKERHSKSYAHAEQMDSESSYAGVPPLPEPEPEEDKPPAPVLAASGARDFFDEVWEAFPRNPGSNELKAQAAVEALTKADRGKLLPAARRYRQWFLEDCEARKRTRDAGLKFVPHLSTWIETDAWRQADALPLKGASQAPIVAGRRLDRNGDAALFEACEAIEGRVPPHLPGKTFAVETIAAALNVLANRQDEPA